MYVCMYGPFRSNELSIPSWQAPGGEPFIPQLRNIPTRRIGGNPHETADIEAI